MRVIVDTCIWSLALRRSVVAKAPSVDQLKQLIHSGSALMLGPVRQELLSGIKEKRQFEALRKALSAFSDVFIHPADYELAAEFYNICRGKGVQGSNTDFLICAVGVRRNLSIFTDDQDYKNYSKLLKITLFQEHAV